MSRDADASIKGMDYHDASTQTDTATDIITLPFTPEASTCTSNRQNNLQNMIGDKVTETILTPKNTSDKSVQTIDVIAAKEKHPEDTSKQLFDKTAGEDLREHILIACDDGSQEPGKLFDQIVEGKQTTDSAVYLSRAQNDVNQEYYAGRYSNGVRHDQQHCPAAQNHNDNIFLGSDDKLVTSNFDVLQLINEEGNTEKYKSAQISDVVKEKGRNMDQLREVTNDLSMSTSVGRHGSITTDSVSIRITLRGRPTGFLLTPCFGEPGAYAMPGIDHHLTSNDVRESRESHNDTIVQHAIPCAEGRIVEPVNFAEINVPNFTIKKVMIAVLTILALGVGLLIMIIPKTRALRIKTPEMNLMTVENIHMLFEGKVMRNVSNTWLIWANITSTHIQDFYANDEGFGINIDAIETIYLDDIYLKKMNYTKIKYSQYFNFTAKSKLITAEDIATIPFSTSKAKDSYIISLKAVHTMFSGIYNFGEVFFSKAIINEVNSQKQKSESGGT